MKITLEFTTPEEAVQADHALRGSQYAYAIEEYRQKLRQISKHNQMGEEGVRILSYVENEFYATFEGLLAD